MDYKDTLLMPKTDFEMRGKLPSKEPAFQQRWIATKIYEEMIKLRKDAPLFILHDGPPYANGEIHLGHALNKILKDVIIRNRFMAGFNVPYTPGWDTHGLPIETAIQKLGHNRKDMNIADFRKLCYEYAMKQVECQKEGFLALGVVGDYDHPYITLTKEYEATQVKMFAKMAQDGLIYKGLKPVYWSPSSESALAEAEIEYQDIKSPTIYVKFAVEDGLGILDSNDSFVIWTTTPWTIPANLAICLNPRMTYALVKSEKGNLLVLEDLIDSIWETLELKEKVIIKTMKGKELERIRVKHPLYDRESLVILGDHVSADAGTGCVHTAPGFGTDDFFACMKYGIEPYCNVDDKGCLTDDSGEWLAGQYVDDANKTVTNRLDEIGALLKLKFITHAYPHDWRTKKPVIYRATTQWFASIDKIRSLVLSEIDKVDWVPSWGQQRMHNMIADRGDWCISRQRAWGVPIPIIYGEDDTPLIDPVIFEHISDLFMKHGSNIWFEKEAIDLLPKGYTSEHSPNGIFHKESDTMDVWFDSGSSHTAALNHELIPYPVDLYFEGSDQYRGWFNSSLIIGCAVLGKAPYKQVLSHGFVMDGKGVKMSKSQWNSVAPSHISKQYGADILRLWACSVDYQSDCSMSDDILKQCSEAYRKVRNTFRFCLANINSEDFSLKTCLKTQELSLLDQYMLNSLNKLNLDVQKAYKEYRFSDVSSMLTNFMSNDLSSYYLDYTKDILYIDKANSIRRKSVQTVIYHMVETLVRCWAPILVHTCEEIHDFMDDEYQSVHLMSFAECVKVNISSEEVHEIQQLLEIRSDVFKALEDARNEKIIGKSLEAHVHISVEEKDKAIIDKYCGDNFAQYLIVSKVSFVNELLMNYGTCGCRIEQCEGSVCPRCWNISEDGAQDGLCKRCQDVLN